MSTFNNLSEAELRKQIRKILADTAMLDEADISDEADFIYDLQLDSVSIIELIVDMEDAFGLPISDEEAEKIHNINDAVSYVMQRLKKA